MADYDYIVIGSGAGGGPVACNLAKAGFKVCLIEAGQEPDTPTYPVPVFHAYASEDPLMSWEFFIKHYSSNPERDGKYVKEKGGIFYPRAGTLGGCTAHHAMIMVYGHASDWDYIAKVTGDDSWSGDNMRQYFERLERCGYVEKPPSGRPNPSRHGYDGWMSTTGPEIELVFGDKALLQTVIDAVAVAWKQGLSGGILPDFIPQDPNDWQRPKFEGIAFAPLATLAGRRAGTREYINATAAALPKNLVIHMNNLATKILFDANKRAVGVECWEGTNLYQADPKVNPNPQPDVDYEVKRYTCAKEVILAGGAFNSPQLLMLSGIGPKDHLGQFGIECIADRPGVGTNLQDRYEVGVVSEMNNEWKILANATFAPPLPNAPGDPCYQDWQSGRGVYATNGAVLAVIKKSSDAQEDPDLFLFALPGKFHGYYPGYSADTERTKKYLTWCILKGHTGNRNGTVRLTSSDPRVRPDINFRYFEEATPGSGKADLDAVVAGVEFARRVSANNSAIKQEVIPGPAVSTPEQIADWVQKNAWGHHASCSNPMGRAGDENAVVDSNFRVIGVDGLRIVDASVFPRIPGFFIVTPIYMIAEKASEAILGDGGQP